MRKFLLLASCFVGVSGANAQILGTGDVSRDSTQILMWAKQQKDNLLMIKQQYDQYTTLVRSFNAIAGARDMNSLVAALGTPVRTYLPDASAALSIVGAGSSMVTGAGAIKGADGVFRSIPQAARAIDTGSRWAEEMARQENTTANIKAMAEQGVVDMRGRMASLAAAQARVATATDIQDIESVKATIQISQANLQQHQITLQNMQLLLHAADRTERTRAEQIAAEGSARWAAATRGSIDQLQGD